MPLTLPGRSENSYRTAQLLISTGKVFMYWLSWIYGCLYDLLAWGAFYNRRNGSIRMFVLQIIPWLYQLVLIWAVGLLLPGLGLTLTAVLDSANTSSPPPVES